MYSYSQAGLPATKRLQVNQVVHVGSQHATETANLDSTYTYNNEGKVTAMTYPSTISGSNTTPGASYNYSYDSMNRLGGMTDSNNNTIVNGVSYDAASRLLGMTYNLLSESRSYNVLGQLTNISVQNLNAPYNTAESLTYNYPTGTNNGKASSMYNAVSGETVTYTYDSLNRMATAAGSGWGESYTLDPFGNLTTKTVTSGSGPSLSVSVNSANQITSVSGQYYDNNGNTYNGNQTAYDAENRLTGIGWSNGAPTANYFYDGQNKRIWSWTVGTLDYVGNVTSYTVNAYSPSGQKLGAYLFVPGSYYSGGNYQPFIGVSLVSSDQYFGGRRLAVMDQLGSAGTYYPWGEAKGNTNPQDTWSYATYWRDSASGLDYANNRYYSNAYGRFMTPDPYTNSGRLNDPGSWNRYAHTRGDPVNRFDPAGRDDTPPATCTTATSDFCITTTTSGDDEGGVPPDTDFDPSNGPGMSIFVPELKITLSPPLQVQLFKIQSENYTLQQAFNEAMQALNSPLCSSLFNVPLGPSPQQVLQDLYNGNTSMELFCSAKYFQMALLHIQSMRPRYRGLTRLAHQLTRERSSRSKLLASIGVSLQATTKPRP
jgi:RHS repeat-associated protein